MNNAPKSNLAVIQSARKAYMICRSFETTATGADPDSYPLWEHATQYVRDAAVSATAYILNNNVTETHVLHSVMCAYHEAHGWSYGPNYDDRIKRDPRLVSYSDLSPDDLVALDLFLTAVLLDIGRL